MSRHSPKTDLILSVSAKLKVGDDQPDAGNYWRDLVGQAIARRTAAVGVPPYEQIGSTVFYAYNFDVGDALQFIFHVDHDYAVGTPIFLHAHWCASGTNVQPVKWQFSVAYAKGHQQEAFPFASPTVVTATQTPAGVQYYHQITEISAADAATLSGTGFETDGLLIVELERLTNGGTDNTDNIYLLTGDCHYQANKFGTKYKAPYGGDVEPGETPFDYA